MERDLVQQYPTTTRSIPTTKFMNSPLKLQFVYLVMIQRENERGRGSMRVIFGCDTLSMS